MKWFFKMMLPALVLASCSKEGGSPVDVSPVSTKENVEVVAKSCPVVLQRQHARADSLEVHMVRC